MNYEEALQQCIRAVRPLDAAAVEAATRRQAGLAKPPGSLGKLEDISIRLAGITGKVRNTIEKKRIVVLCADNGVVEEGVSSAPRSVTVAQAMNMTRYKTGMSSLAKHFGNQVVVVDVGIADPYDNPLILNRNIRKGTRNLLHEPAMTREETLRAILTGIDLARAAAREGVQALGVGEMGIGNTTTSSAVLSVLTGLPVEQLTGRGGGLTDAAFAHKKQVITEAISLHNPNPDDPVAVLSAVGGLDLAAMAGVFLGAAEQRVPVVVDGFISTVAALCAARLCPDAKEYMFPSHSSVEIGTRRAASELGLDPWLDMNMRLGEGSGCPLAFEILSAACAVMNNMALFGEEAHIDDGYLEEIRQGDKFSV